MKKLISYILLAVFIVLLFAGCEKPPAESPDNTSGQLTQPTTQPTQPTIQPTDPTTQPTEPVIVEDIEGPLAQYVQTAVKETLKQAKSKYGPGDESTSVRIPKLLPFSEDAIVAQTEIQAEFDPIIASIRANYAEGFGTVYEAFDYSAYLNDSILSLMILINYMTDDFAYRVYNFDITTGKRLDTHELMTKLQIPDYTEAFTRIAKKKYEEDNQHQQDNDDYASQLAKTIAKENIEKAIPYIAEDGKVMVVIKIYAFVGTDYHFKAIPLS